MKAHPIIVKIAAGVVAVFLAGPVAYANSPTIRAYAACPLFKN